MALSCTTRIIMSRKTVQLKIMVDEQTKRAWTRAAAESGLSLSEWVRIRCNGVQIEAQAPSVPARKVA